MTKKIHDENQNNPEVPINLRGLGIGNGAMDPPNSDVYADYLYQVFCELPWCIKGYIYMSASPVGPG